MRRSHDVGADPGDERFPNRQWPVSQASPRRQRDIRRRALGNGQDELPRNLALPERAESDVELVPGQHSTDRSGEPAASQQVEQQRQITSRRLGVSVRKVRLESDALVAELIKSLDQQAQERYDHLVAFASQKHALHDRLRRSRMTLFHYPVMHPGKEQAGAEELANALRAARDLVGWIESGEDYASFRAVFADDVAVQLLAESNEATEEIMETLREPVFELVEFAEAVLLEQLKRAPPDKTTIWPAGEPKPEIQ